MKSKQLGQGSRALGVRCRARLQSPGLNLARLVQTEGRRVDSLSSEVDCGKAEM